jgi:hypothetical protein
MKHSPERISIIAHEQNTQSQENTIKNQYTWKKNCYIRVEAFHLAYKHHIV